MMNATGVDQFHDDLQAAIVSGVPLDLHRSGTGDVLTVGRVNELRKQIQPHVDLSGKISVPDDSLEFSTRYIAALETFLQTRTMLPVLEGLTIREASVKEVAQIIRWPFYYLVILSACACAGLILFSSRVYPNVAFVDADTQTMQTFDSNAFDVSQMFPVIIIILAVISVVLLIWVMVGGVRRTALWLGGTHYVRCRTATTTLQVTQMLIESGMSFGQAVATSCDLTGADKKLRRQLSDAVSETEELHELETLSDYLRISAHQRLANLKVFAPVALVSCIGGAIAVLYCVLIFWPIISLLKRLSEVVI